MTDQGSNFVKCFNNTERVDKSRLEDHILSEIQDPILEVETQDPVLESETQDQLNILTFENVNNQLSDLMNEAETFSFRNRIQISPSAITFETISEIQQDNEIPFEIDIADTMRFSCSCHKLNIVLFRAIEDHKIFAEKLDRLQNFAIESRKKRIFEENDCRPKLMVQTRWFSQVNTLIWAKKCYEKSLIAENDCPLSYNDIDTYLQILLPAYYVNLLFQRTSSTVGDVLPHIFKLKSIWSHQELDMETRELTYFLIQYLEQKFEYETNSDIYKVNTFLKA